MPPASIKDTFEGPSFFFFFWVSIIAMRQSLNNPFYDINLNLVYLNDDTIIKNVKVRNT